MDWNQTHNIFEVCLYLCSLDLKALLSISQWANLKVCKDIAEFWKVTSGNFEIKIWIWNPFFVDIDGITDLDFAKDDLTSR